MVDEASACALDKWLHLWIFAYEFWQYFHWKLMTYIRLDDAPMKNLEAPGTRQLVFVMQKQCVAWVATEFLNSVLTLTPVSETAIEMCKIADPHYGNGHGWQKATQCIFRYFDLGGYVHERTKWQDNISLLQGGFSLPRPRFSNRVATCGTRGIRVRVFGLFLTNHRSAAVHSNLSTSREVSDRLEQAITISLLTLHLALKIKEAIR